MCIVFKNKSQRQRSYRWYIAVSNMFCSAHHRCQNLQFRNDCIIDIIGSIDELSSDSLLILGSFYCDALISFDVVKTVNQTGGKECLDCLVTPVSVSNTLHSKLTVKSEWLCVGSQRGWVEHNNIIQRFFFFFLPTTLTINKWTVETDWDLMKT